ncbi:M20 family metallo-hydrolase [Bacillus gobiensis]|uniref:M20 family metallo-hydrolase n=1 Tax=Bacillus gobiensis TaxID=1441095 RepID=UPI003D1C9F69
MSFSSDTLRGDKPQLDQLLSWLASYGKTKDNGVTRLLYSKEWQDAQLALYELMESYGLKAYFDDAGNLFGRIEGTEDSQATILTGSHVDSVVNGGRFDGAFGIVASLQAVSQLLSDHGPPKKTIEVVSLCEEEGSRFPLTFWGSGNITGVHDLKKTPPVRDAEGVGLEAAMHEAGFGKRMHPDPYRTDITCFLELHIEQGNVLERSGNSIGLVTDIVGQKRYTVTIKGASNHAGTTPMQNREDALAAASECIYYMTKEAKKTDPHLVATAGKMSVKPNVPNVIAESAEFTVDIRHHNEDLLEKFSHDLFAAFERISNQSEVKMAVSQWTNVKPVPLNADLKKLFAEEADALNISYQEMTSGAGHDSQVFGTYCPTMLVFVPSHKGISHSPLEWTNNEDLTSGCKLLTSAIYQLAYE